ncbi:hypothetical protein ACET3Z_027779 [Daucus carota]
MNLKIHSTTTTTITASQITPRVRKKKGQFSVKEPIFVTMGDQEEVKLFAAWSSSFSKRVEIALKMKGINYKYVAESLSNKSPELLRYNPVHKKVPVVIHYGKPICESLVILEYIDEIWKSGPSILPEDPHARAMSRFWVSFIDEKCSPAIKRIYRSQGEEQEKAVQDATEHLERLENELRGKKFFGGDEIGLVDLSATFIALWLVAPKEKFPRLCEWINIYLNCSIVKETLPAREDLLDHLHPIFVAKGDQEVKLVGVWGSCPSKRLEIALKIKGIHYEFVAQDLSNKSPELLEYNSVHKQVPVLLHNGKPICESLVILEYIDKTWKSGPSILPEDTRARAMARFWAKLIDDKCCPAILRIKRSQEEEEREKANKEAMEYLETLENELKGKNFFGGDEIGLVDIAGM